MDSSAEDDSNNVVSRPTISNKDNGRIRSYTYSVSDRSDPNTGVCSLCELLHPWCCLSKSGLTSTPVLMF